MEEEMRRDQRAKMVVRNKDVLAEILIGAVPGFSGMTREEVKALIPGEGNIADMRATVLDAPSEKTVIMDTCFDIGGDDPGSVIVAVDIQGYRVSEEESDGRMVMYASKLISSQMLPGSQRRYADIRKTHCVWVDLHPRPELRNSIFVGRIAFEKVAGRDAASIGPSELLSITRIGLGVSTDPSGHRLLDILNTLWSGTADTGERTRELEGKYKIDVNPYMERGLVEMGDLIAELTEYGKHLQREDDEAEISELRTKLEDASARAEKERAEKEEERARSREFESRISSLEKENAELKAKLAARKRTGEDWWKWGTS